MSERETPFVSKRPVTQDDHRVCRRCTRGWGSVLVTPPEGYFSIRNKYTGTFHGLGRSGRTACGVLATGQEWERV